MERVEGGGDHLRGILGTEEDAMLLGNKKTWNIHGYNLIMQNYRKGNPLTTPLSLLLFKLCILLRFFLHLRYGSIIQRSSAKDPLPLF